MRTIIKGKNIQVNDDLKRKVEEKLGKITRHNHYVNIKELEVKFSVEKNPSIEAAQTVEITAFTKGPVIRAKKASADMFSSIDMVVDKLDRQFEKYKGKSYRSQNHKARHEAIALKETKPSLVERRKNFSTKPMTVEEAILQMELIDHDFFVFRNAENDKISVVYSRKGIGFGLLEPEE